MSVLMLFVVSGMFVFGWHCHMWHEIFTEWRDSRSLSELDEDDEHTIPLSEKWHLPSLIRTPRCPDGYSAAQILGYRTVGGTHQPPLYPGGFDAYRSIHTHTARTD